MKFTDYKTYKTAVGGRLLQVEIGKVAELANAAVTMRYGDTVVNVTAVMSKNPRPDIDFFPLQCEFEEKMYSVGKIPGGFIKREGRPSEKAVLSSRLMDRPLRPLFPEGFYNDVQVVATVWCVDPDCSADIVAMLGSSIALSISDIPFDGPTASVLIGRVDGRFIINPSLKERDESDIHLVVSGTRDAIMMVEAGANEVPEEEILEGILLAHEEIKKIIEFIDEIVKEVGKEKIVPEIHQIPDEISEAVKEFASSKMKEAIRTVEKTQRQENMDKVEEETRNHFMEIYPENGNDIEEILYNIKKEEVRGMIINEGIRPDNRKTDEIRPIWCETSFLPRTHGTGLFTRGQTQVLSITTLAPMRDAQTIDGITEDTEKRYMHHYNFPPSSVGEARPIRSPGRREIGHGALAEKALVPVLPSEEEFPYAIRVVSEVLSSNGSTSQASVCGSTLSLMDAGVPIKAPVAGIAMGLIKEDDKVAILSDIQGMEDFLGDMDFKVAGTRKGVTAIQMDIKIHGLSEDIMKEALIQAREGRMFIMDKMMEEIKEPRPQLSKYAPRIISFTIDPEKIRLVIGKGGSTINKIIAETDAEIDIDNDGTVSIYSPDTDSLERARKEIELLTKDTEVGDVYDATVVKIMPFGAFVEYAPGKEGLIHISKLAKKRVDKVEDVVDIGDVVKVIVTEIDSQNRVNLSMRDLL